MPTIIPVDEFGSHAAQKAAGQQPRNPARYD
jgi:hypothetical protein